MWWPGADRALSAESCGTAGSWKFPRSWATNLGNESDWRVSRRSHKVYDMNARSYLLVGLQWTNRGDRQGDLCKRSRQLYGKISFLHWFKWKNIMMTWWYRGEMRDRDSCSVPGTLWPPSKRLSQVTEQRERRTVTHTVQMVKVYLQ